MIVGTGRQHRLQSLRAPVIRDAQNFGLIPLQLFNAAEKEQLPPHDRAAEERAEALLAERRSFVEVIGLAVCERTGERRAVELGVAEEAVGAALKSVRPAARADVQ